MRDQAEMSVLRRKTGTVPPAPALAAMTPAKAMRLALARAGDEALGCIVGLRDLKENRGLPDAAMSDLPDMALVIQLNGPNGACGIAILCPQVVAAVIEAQTIGQVLTVAAANRAPTRTDAMLVAGFLDFLLAGFAALADASADAPPLLGFACGDPLPDVRAGAMTLQEAAHHHFAVEIDFSKGAKSGKLHLIVPLATSTDISVGEKSGWSEKLNHAVLGSTTRLEAILCRQRMTLADISAFAVGDIVRLNTASLDRVSLSGTNGKILMTASLGRSGAMRALRLELGPEHRKNPPATPQLAEP